MNQFGKHFCSTFTFNREHTDDSVSLRYFRSQFISYFFYLITCARYSTLHKSMTLELARPLLKKSSCAACIMRRALVFHLDPAAPVPASAAVDLSSPLITDLLITSQLLITTHHNSSHLITYQVITAPLLTPHSSQLHCSSQLITAPLLTGPLLITTHRNLSHPNPSQLHFSQLHYSSQLITAPLLITTHHNLSHPNSSQLHFSHLTSQVHFSHLTSHTSPKFTLTLDT